MCDGPAESTYNSLIKLISRAISQVANVENTSHNIDDLMQVVRLELKAQCKLNNVESMLNQVLICYKQYKAVGATGDQMLHFFKTVLEVISLNFPVRKESTENIQTVLLDIYSDIFKDLLQTELQTNTFESCNCSIRVIVDFQVKQNLSQDYLDSFSIFEIVSALYPDELQKLDEKIKTINQLSNVFKKRNKNAFFNVLNYVNRPLQELLLYYKNGGSERWINLSQDVILNVLKLFQDLTLHVNQVDWECISIKNPTEQSCKCLMCLVHIVAFKIGGHVTDLVKSYIRNHCNTLDNNFFATVLVWLNYYFDWLKKIKEAKWQYWTPVYTDLSAYAYNLGVVLFNNENHGHTLINRCLLKHIFEIEGAKPKVITQRNISFLFTSIADGLFKTENFIGGLAVAAMHCLLYPEESEIVIRREWIKKKVSIFYLLI